MSDLISRSALIKLRRKVVEYDEAGFSMDYFAVPVEEIKNAPTVEAKTVVHGEWVHLGGDEWYCSECCHVIFTEGSWEKPKVNFCEECGADMRKEVE